MKRILIDGTTISLRMDGLSQYILNVVSRLPLYPDRHYTVVVRARECAEDYIALWRQRGMEVVVAAIDPIGWRREGQFSQWLRTQQAFDAALIPSNQFPTAVRIPSIYVVHDLIYERYPEQLGKLAWAKRIWLHHNVSQGLRLAKRVVAVSEFTKDEIVRFHPKADAGKIEVVYEGWEHLKKPIKETSCPIPFREYILYIGSSRGHKNMQRLLEGLSLVSDQLPEGTGLVIAGDDRMFTREQCRMLKVLEGKVVTTGWLNQAELSFYSRQAKAVIFPSLCEGFGIPVLEAFYFRKPLLLSRTASLPEVAADAALYFDPTQPQEIAQALIQGLEMSEEEQSRWIEKGEERLKLFSWQKTADEIDKILTQILHS